MCLYHSHLKCRLNIWIKIELFCYLFSFLLLLFLISFFCLLCFYCFCILFIFCCTRSSLQHASFLWLRQVGVLSSRWCVVSHHSGFSRCRAQTLGCTGSEVWCTGLVASRHVDLPRPGIEPLSPALAGRSLTTGPPGKSCLLCC